MPAGGRGWQVISRLSINYLQKNMLAVGAGVREPEKTSPRPNGSIENHG
jgi:hypothetical protein